MIVIDDLFKEDLYDEFGSFTKLFLLNLDDC